MNNQHIPPFDPQRLKEAKQKLDNYLEKMLSPTPDYRSIGEIAPLETEVTLYSVEGGEDSFLKKDFIPAAKNAFKQIGGKKFPIIGYYETETQIQVVLDTSSVTPEEFKKLCRVQRRSQHKAYK